MCSDYENLRTQYFYLCKLLTNLRAIHDSQFNIDNCHMHFLEVPFNDF